MSHEPTSPVPYRETAYKYLTIKWIRERDDVERVHAVGEVDLCTASVLAEALADTDRRETPNVLVDLSQVSFLALGGVRMLLTAGKRRTEANRGLAVVAPTPSVQRVLSLTDVTGELAIYVSVPSALSALPVPYDLV